ncbi:hypothetical protein LOC67_06930 [Stieleria sp. JC731]|uniref:hypothetical protein n=1 Tax=Pirellulaceae TaxID=2691357 RepID=UPI001E57B850|nr:hypothetical protein [Stieleria sp. JC731]MCC9600290.1 hypothetical protein [Stieleria sp. JC731]
MKLCLTMVLSAVIATVLPSQLQAAIYTIDSSSSSNTFGFDFGASTLTETSAGSSVTTLSGILDATVTLGGGAIVFSESGGSGTSNIIFDAGTASQYFPNPGGSLAQGFDDILSNGDYDPNGNGDGQFTAGTTNASLTFNNLAYLSISNHVMTFAGSGVTGGLNSGITADVVGYTSIDSAAIGIDNAERRIIDDGLAMTNFGNIGYSLVGDVETLTIPYDITIDGGGGNFFYHTGTVVASRTITAIPEPASGAFLACLVAGTCVSVRRRRK